MSHDRVGDFVQYEITRKVMHAKKNISSYLASVAIMGLPLMSIDCQQLAFLSPLPVLYSYFGGINFSINIRLNLLDLLK